MSGGHDLVALDVSAGVDVEGTHVMASLGQSCQLQRYRNPRWDGRFFILHGDLRNMRTFDPATLTTFFTTDRRTLRYVLHACGASPCMQRTVLILAQNEQWPEIMHKYPDCQKNIGTAKMSGGTSHSVTVVDWTAMRGVWPGWRRATPPRAAASVVRSVRARGGRGPGGGALARLTDIGRACCVKEVKSWVKPARSGR